MARFQKESTMRHALAMSALVFFAAMMAAPSRGQSQQQLPPEVHPWQTQPQEIQPPQSQKLENPIAVFAALDKVTGRISPLEIPIGVSVEFGALTVTPRVCYTRPPTEPPMTSAFVEVDETKLSGEKLRIFTGWMFAQSPGLHAVEHPVFDVWLTNCKMEEGAQPDGNAPKSPDPSNASSKSP